MTFYAETVLKMGRDCYPGPELTRHVIRAKRFIDDHYAEPIELAEMAAEACCSKFHFIRLFRSLYGRTPYQHLISVRVEKAGQLLRAGAGVADVCYRVGFDSVTSFTGLFKRKMGATPAVYQKQKIAILKKCVQ